VVAWRLTPPGCAVCRGNGSSVHWPAGSRREFHCGALGENGGVSAVPKPVLFVIVVVILIVMAVLIDPHHGIGKLF
jgi:hypothetical protein